MSLGISPEPTPEEAEAIAVALAEPAAPGSGGWADAALADTAENEPEP